MTPAVRRSRSALRRTARFFHHRTRMSAYYHAVTGIGPAASVLAVAVALLSLGCAPDTDADPRRITVEPAGIPPAAVVAAFERAGASADSVEQLLLPVPLLTPAQESALRRASNAQQLARARSLGTHVADTATARRLLTEGRLVVLEDSSDAWVLRELRQSLPYVTPDTHALLRRIGLRFQEKLQSMGLPAYRIEITSALRTPDDQAALRATNPNAARGRSTHEYGTTVDIAYSGYGAPEPEPEPEPEP